MKCGAVASHTQRIVDGRPAHKDEPLVVIGATDAYEARCRRCYELRGERKRKKK
jgi:thymidine kinase